MNPDLAHLVRLHQIELDIEARRQAIAALPERLRECDVRVADAEATLAEARQRAAENQAARRTLERDLAVAQGRLGKFKDQLMDVKTNREYVAMQHEIAMAQEEVRGFEDRLLDLMLAADELQASVKAAETQVTDETRLAAEERARRTTEGTRMQGEVSDLERQREGLTADMSREAMALYQRVAERRRGSVMATVRDGHCAACNVRLRPPVYQEVLRGERPVQCESCFRILYVATTPQLTPNPSPAS